MHQISLHCLLIFQEIASAKIKLMTKSLEKYGLENGPIYVEQTTKHMLQACSNLLTANHRTVKDVLKKIREGGLCRLLYCVIDEYSRLLIVQAFRFKVKNFVILRISLIKRLLTALIVNSNHIVFLKSHAMKYPKP